MDTRDRDQTRTDAAIRGDVVAELDWSREVTSTDIGVAVHHGVVTLSGEVRSYAERVAARRAARTVRGVAALADDLVVGDVAAYRHTDTQIAESIVLALSSRIEVAHLPIRAEVTDGRVTLRGELPWHHQRQAARRIVERLAGVRSVTDRMTLVPRASADDTAERIGRALARNAEVDAAAIRVEVDGSEVTLSGTVRSWAERAQAAIAAWGSPNVTMVHNDLVVA